MFLNIQGKRFQAVLLICFKEESSIAEITTLNEVGFAFNLLITFLQQNDPKTQVIV